MNAMHAARQLFRCSYLPKAVDTPPPQVVIARVIVKASAQQWDVQVDVAVRRVGHVEKSHDRAPLVLQRFLHRARLQPQRSTQSLL